VQEVGSYYLEALEWLAPPVPGEDEDELLQAHLGEKVMARTVERQVAELNVRAPSSIASPSWARPRRLPWHNYVWGLGSLSLRPIYAIKPILGSAKQEIVNSLSNVWHPLLLEHFSLGDKLSRVEHKAPTSLFFCGI
jgi:hypothetical protein